ncbi:MAG: hypothetical protein LBW85_00750, partial [Deltaproteobacteria bacterium]|nr:hypothetical protein [Deltaproteobacteria bacterium]
MVNDQPFNDKKIILSLQKDELNHQFALLVESFTTKQEFEQLTKLLNWLSDYKNDFNNILNNNNNMVSKIDIFEKLGLQYDGKFKNLLHKIISDDVNNIDEALLILKKKQEYSDKGIILKNFRIASKNIITLLGTIKINRTNLRPKTRLDVLKLNTTENLHSITPLDEYLGINRLPFKMTIGAMLEIAYWVQRSNSYEEAEEGLQKYTRINVKKDTIRLVTNNVGKLVFENDFKQAEKSFEILNKGNLSFPSKKLNHDFYIECDGAMFHTRERDENGYTWKENKLGMVFCSDTFLSWKNKKTDKREIRIGNREYTAYAGSVDIFQKLLFNIAIQNGYGQYKNTILISDGAMWIKNMKELCFPDAVHILDFFYLCENINKFAKEYFNENKDIYEPWVADLCQKLKNSEIKSVLDILNSLNRKTINKCSFNLLNYINKNINSIDYKLYIDNGWFIGSGAIESANKIVLQERLKQAGMRWNIETARYIIALMTKVKSK